MNLELRNIGVLDKADVRLDGMTVITGFNNTGKSTVGKALYSLFHGMNYYQDSIERDRVRYLMEPFLYRMRGDTTVVAEGKNDYTRYLSKLNYLISTYFGKSDADYSGEAVNFPQLKKQVEAILKEMNLPQSNIEMLMEVFSANMHEVLQPSFLLKVKRNVVRKTFSEEFSGHYLNAFNEGKSYISVWDDSNEYKVVLSDENFPGVEKNIPASLNFDDVILIDTPMILNYMLENNFFIDWGNSYNHQQELIKKITNESAKLRSRNIVKDSIAREQIGNLKAVTDKIEEVLNVNVSVKDANILYEINSRKVGISSLASGLKSYVIIKLLIDNGYLNSKSLLIIDEPEVHLHPEWQMNLAEILVMLQKEVGIKVVLTTHSPYFLQAIDVYSRKHGIDGKTHFYLAEKTEDCAVLNSIDDNLEATYKMLVSPFLALRDMDEDMSME